MAMFGNAQAVNELNLGMRLFKPSAVAAPNWWDPNDEGLCIVGAYQARAAASYLGSLVNLSNPGVNDLVEGNGAVPWDAVNGWGFVAVFAQWFDTGLVPTNDQNYSMLVRYANVVNTGYLAGMRHGAGTSFRLRPDSGGNRVIYENGGARSVTPAMLVGNLAVAGNQGYRNGAADGGAIGAWTGGATLPIFVGCRNTFAPLNFISGDIYAVAIYNCTLTGPQVLAVVTAMALL